MDTLFPILGETLELSQKHQELVRLIELMRTNGLFARYGWVGNGRKPSYRELLFRAFVARAVVNLPTNINLLLRLKTDRTLRALCGYDGIGEVPSESTCSTAETLYDSFVTLRNFWRNNDFKHHRQDGRQPTTVYKAAPARHSLCYCCQENVADRPVWGDSGGK